MVSAAELARAYDAYVSALWRGDADPARFATWLSVHWHTGPVPLPITPPAEISPCGGGGHGIHWHDTPMGVLGCVPGVDGCYFVPPDATPPNLGALPTDVLLSVCYSEDPMAVPPDSRLTNELLKTIAATRPTHEAVENGLCG